MDTPKQEAAKKLIAERFSAMPFRFAKIKAQFSPAFLLSTLPLLAVSSAFAQTVPALSSPSAAPPAPLPRTATVAVLRAVERLSTEAGVSVLADSIVAYERVPASLPGTTTTLPEAEIEKQLNALVKTLPPGTLWVKLYLPAPAPGRTWKGDDVSAFAFAQARLFGTVGVPATDGSIEILGKRVAKDATPTYVSGLGLKPVYLVTNTRRQVGPTPWSAANEKQWATMTGAERKQFGQEQAALFLSLPPDQQAQMMEQIKQHDTFFDTVKGPIEKVIGHDL